MPPDENKKINKKIKKEIFFPKNLYEKKNIPVICKKIKNHCKPSINIDRDKITDSFLKNLNKSFHRTNKHNTYTFNECFKEHHTNHFNKLFPKDTLKILGYVDE